MIKVPILFNGDYSKGSMGNVEMGPELEALYSSEESNYFVINPILRIDPDGTEEVIAFGVYPMPAEPKVEKKKRGRPKKVK
jgi:hypothetical protein